MHWKGLRGEAVAAGMISGLSVTIGLVFSPVNVKLAAGFDQTACGLSTAMIGFFVNLFITVVLGLIMQYKPQVFGNAVAAVRNMVPAYEHINLGSRRDSLLNPYLWVAMVLVLLFSVPFYRSPGSPDKFIGDMSAWAFVALFCSGILAILVAFAYTWLWQDWTVEDLPATADGKGLDSPTAAEQELSAAVAANKDVAA
jgi:Na+(H+)/acetate symporter ActP